jgi:hypothetical protein
LGQHREDLILLREAPFGMLREEELAVDDDVEDPIVSLKERGLYARVLVNSGRQTGGLGEVVSAYAIGDLDLHRPGSSCGGRWAGASRSRRTL